MERRSHRRRSKRYPANWKVAVVFGNSDGRPVLHTHTEDLSIGGTSIRSPYGDLTGSEVTLLLARPPRRGSETQKLLRLRARVVSSSQSPGRSGFRHGLSFVASLDDGLAMLAEIIKDADSVRTAGEAAADPDTTLNLRASDMPSALAAVHRLAQAKPAGAAVIRPDLREEMMQRVSDALYAASQYLKKITAQLNDLKPAYLKGYAIPGVPDFNGLAWEEGRVDVHVADTPSKAKRYEQVALHFALSGKKEIRETRANPAHEKLKQVLTDNGIEFTAVESRNERGAIEQTTFVFPCQVTGSLQLVGNFDTGKLLLKARNVERFGLLEHVLAPEAIIDESLEELSAFILGETSRLGPLLLKNA